MEPQPAPEAAKATQRTIAIAAPGILVAPRLQHDPVQVKNAASGTRIVTLHPRQARAPVPAGSYAVELNGSMMTIEVAAGETVELPEPAIIKITNFDAHGAGGSQVKVKNVDSGLGTVMSRRRSSAAFWPGTYQVEPASGGVHTVSVAAGEELTVDLAGIQ